MNTNTPSRPPPGYQGPKPGSVRNLNDRLSQYDLMLIPTTATLVPSRKKSSGTPCINRSPYTHNSPVSSNGCQGTQPGIIEYQITSRSATLSKAEIELRLDFAAGIDKARQARFASSNAGSFESEVIEVAVENEDDDLEDSDTEADEEEDDEQDVVMEDSQEAVIVDSQGNGSSFHPSFTVDGAGEDGMPIRGVLEPRDVKAAVEILDIVQETGSAVTPNNSELVERMMCIATALKKSHDLLLDGDDDSEGTKRKKRKLRNMRRRRQGRS